MSLPNSSHGFESRYPLALWWNGITSVSGTEILGSNPNGALEVVMLLKLIFFLVLVNLALNVAIAWVLWKEFYDV